MTKKNINKVILPALISIAAIFPFNLSYAHSGGGNSVAWDVCKDKEKSTACEFTGAHEALYIGTCQSIAKSMLCVRNKPVKYPESYKPEDHGKAHSSSSDSKPTSTTSSIEPLEITKLEKILDTVTRKYGRNRAIAI